MPPNIMRLAINLYILLFLVLTFSVVGCGVHSGSLIEEYNDFGVKCAKMGLWDEAIMRWKRIVEIDPNNAKAHNNLGVAYESKRELDAALAEYRMAMELDPDNRIYMSNYTKFKRSYQRASKRNETQDSRLKTEE